MHANSWTIAVVIQLASRRTGTTSPTAVTILLWDPLPQEVCQRPIIVTTTNRAAL